MPYDANGIYSRVHRWQDDRDNGIRILANRHDEEDDSLAGALNQAFLRSGVVPMTGPMVMNGNVVSQVRAGTPLQPGITFELDVDTGFFQPAAGQLAVSVNGVQKGLWTDSGLDVAGNITVNGIEIGSGGGSIGDDITIPGDIVARNITATNQMYTPRYYGGLLKLEGPHNFYISKLGSGDAHDTDPLINFDDADYFKYDQAANRLSCVINGVEPFAIQQNLVRIPSALVDMVDFTPSGTGFALYRGGAGGTDPILGFDSNDYLHYQRGIDELHIVVGGVDRFSLGPVNTSLTGTLYVGADISCRTLFGAAGGAPGPAVHVGNDASLWDVNIANTMAVRGQADANSGFITFGNNNLRLGCNAGDSRLIYGGGAVFFGLVQMQGSGGGGTAIPAASFYNSTVGHDYRIWAKDTPDGGLYITNESIGVAYIGFSIDGQIHVARNININNTSNFNMRAWVWQGMTIQNGLELSNATLTIKDRVDSSYWQFYQDNGVHRFWFNGGGDRLLFDVSKCYPVADRAYTLGWAGLRWDQVYCASSSMNTSDAREKDWRGSLNDAELAASKALCKEIGIYRWLRDLERDGDAAKLQCGILAQKVIEVFQANGLDALAYGFVSHQIWEATTYNDADMKEQTNPAGERYFIMFPDLLAFITVGIDQRLTALGG